MDLVPSLLLFFADDDLPPELVDQHHDDGARTIGGVLPLYAPRTADGRDLPVDLDRRLLEDARAFVNGVAELSRATGVTFGFELDQDSVGWVENGEPDDSVTVGLLGEWERVLESRA